MECESHQIEAVGCSSMLYSVRYAAYFKASEKERVCGE